MNEKLIAVSNKFWEYLEKADVAGMESIADPGCTYVHIGVTCGMDEKIEGLVSTMDMPVFGGSRTNK